MNYVFILLIGNMFFSFSAVSFAAAESFAKRSEIRMDKSVVRTFAHAIKDKDKELVQKMLEEYPQLIHLENSQGNTFLHTAYQYKTKKSIIRLLLKSGADKNACNKLAMKPKDYSYIDTRPFLPIFYEVLAKYNEENK